MNIAFELTYLIFIAGTLIFSFLINSIFLKFVRSLGIRNTSDTVIRWNETSKPSIGGLSFYIIFLLSISFISFAFDLNDTLIQKREIGILGACSLGFLMGLADDAYNTNPTLKSLTQIACGLILIFTGTTIQLFDNQIVNVVLTLIWVMGIMNSINMLDNMDGITGLVSLVILLTILGAFIVTGFVANFYFILISGMVCALIGFLYFNLHPSKMFMGDCGSQFLGIFLAALGIIFYWNLEPLEMNKISLAKKVIIPVLAFIVPIADTTTVVINRLARGHSPFVGGKDHTTHNLARIGLKDKQVTLVIGLVSAISGIIILYTYNDNYIRTGKVIGLLCYILIIVAALYSVTQIKKNKSL